MLGRQKALLIALVILLVAFALRLVNCQRGMWGDEITTFWVLRLPLADLVPERLAHNHLPTYFLLLRQWTALMGDSTLSMRFPSILAGALTVAVFFLVCVRRFPRDVSLLAASFLALNSTHLFVSQSSRMYGLTALLEVLFFACFLRDWAGPSWKSYLGYGAVAVAGCSMHLLFLQMAAVVVLFIFWEKLASARRVRRTLAEGSTGAAFEADAEARGNRLARSAPLPARATLRYLVPFVVGAGLFGLWATQSQVAASVRQTTGKSAWLDVNSTPLPLKVPGPTPAKHRVVDPSRTMARIPLGDPAHWRFLQLRGPKYLARAVVFMAAGWALWSAFRTLRKSGTLLDVSDHGAARGWLPTEHPPCLDQLQALRLAVLWILVPPLLVLTAQMAFVWVPALQARHLAGATAPWALLMGCATFRLRHGSRARRAVTCAALGLAAFFAVGWLRYAGDGLPQAFTHWRNQARPADKVFLVHRGYWEKCLEAEGIPLPPESLRGGTSLNISGPDLASRLRDFAKDDPLVWLLHYYAPSTQALQQAFAILANDWRVSLDDEFNACSVYRLTRTSNER